MLLLRTLGLGDLSLCTAHAQHSVCNHAPRTSTKTLIKQSTRSVSSSSSNMPCSIAVDCNPYWAMQLIRTHLVPHSSPVRLMSVCKTVPLCRMFPNTAVPNSIFVPIARSTVCVAPSMICIVAQSGFPITVVHGSTSTWYAT